MKNTKAFTLVELIVVVTILAILGTIGFVSYSSYLTGVRDANRTSSLEAISTGLSLYATAANNLPIPDQEVQILSGSTIVAYQGQAGVTVLETIDYSKAGTDPLDNEPYRYLIDDNRRYHQLVAFAEDSSTSIVFNGLFSQAHAVDLSLRYPVFYGEKLGMFIEDSGDRRPLDAIIGSDITLPTITGYEIFYDEGTSVTSVTAESYANTVSVG